MGLFGAIGIGVKAFKGARKLIKGARKKAKKSVRDTKKNLADSISFGDANEKQLTPVQEASFGKINSITSSDVNRSDVQFVNKGSMIEKIKELPKWVLFVAPVAVIGILFLIFKKRRR